MARRVRPLPRPSLFLLARRTTSVRPLLGLWVAAVALALVQPRISDRLDLGQFVPSFLPGIIGFYLTGTTRRRWPSWAWPVFLAALWVAYRFSQPYEHGWVLCLLAGLALPHFRELRHGWVRRAAHELAKYSYGTYLTHVFALWFAFVRLAALPLAARAAVFLVLLVSLPVLLYHTLEAPLIRYGARLADRWFPQRRDDAVFAGASNINGWQVLYPLPADPSGRAGFRSAAAPHVGSWPGQARAD